MKISARRARPDTYTKLLVKAFGANGSQVFKDFSQSAHTITSGGTHQISTTQSKFPPVSIYIANGYLTSAANADFNIWGGDATIEMWGYLYVPTSQQILVSGYIDGSHYWNVASDVASGGKLRFAHINAGDNLILDGTSDINDSTQTHIAVVKSGNTVTLYVNGVSENSGTLLSSFGSNCTLWIGAFNGGTPYMNGFLDQIRISKGIARYTSNFTPPTRRF